MKWLMIVPVVIAGFASSGISGEKPAGIVYVSPLPGSTMVSASTNIILRGSDPISGERLAELRGAVITGSATGDHATRFVTGDDGRTAVLRPDPAFAPGETVTVRLSGSFAFSWSFTVSRMTLPPSAFPPSTEWSAAAAGRSRSAPLRTLSRPDTVPSNFPVMKIDTLNNPEPGSIFLTTTDILAGLGFYVMVLDNAGNPVGYRSTAPYSSNDFKIQPDGLLSYASVTGIAGAVGIAKTVEMVMDSTLAVVDSFQCGNGYTADFHEFLHLPNGHAVMMAYDPQVVDMSQVVPGGKPNAVVYGSILQELDAAKNVVFQWRSWDYIPITDCYDDLTASAFDYIHVNSIEVDTDGNFLVSCRETAEILKIDHLTGDVIWRWGGKHNQFTFVGENGLNAPNYFSYQHDVRRIANGHITLMDNGNQHQPPYSRGAEYALDETGKTATLVWEYRHVPDVFNPAAGSVQRLPGGNTLVGWGTANFLGVGDVAVTEVRPDKSVAFEMSMPKGLFSYRAFRYPWKSGLPSATVSRLDLHPGVTTRFDDPGQTTGVSIMLTSGDAMYSRVIVTRYPFSPLSPSFGPNAPDLAPLRATIVQAGFSSYNAVVTFDSTYAALFPAPEATTVYSRVNEGSGAFSPLATTYDAGKRSLSVTTSQFGEFAFGWSGGSAAITPPALIAPADRAFVNEGGPVSLSWSSRGSALRYILQVATDSAFAHMAVQDSTAAVSYVLTSPLHDTVYYWRVQASGDSLVSAASPFRRFITRAPFIAVTYPAGGETLYRDTAYVLRWQTNQAGPARVVLMNGSGPVLTLADSAPNSGAFLWTVPGTLPLSGGYRLSVRSVADTTIGAASGGSFAVGSVVLSTGAGDGLPHVFALDQNYPNPFNPSTAIRYALPQRATVALEVYNTLGQRVATLVDGTEEPGFHEARFDGTNLASGLYFYRLRAQPGDFTETKKLLLVR